VPASRGCWNETARGGLANGRTLVKKVDYRAKVGRLSAKSNLSLSLPIGGASCGHDS
jgi:hypothetical protein